MAWTRPRSVATPVGGPPQGAQILRLDHKQTAAGVPLDVVVA